jgi:hypothetical protein
MTAVSTLVLVVIGLAILGWLSSKPDKRGVGSRMARPLSVLTHLLAWMLILGGISAGVILMVYAITLEIVVVGLFGLFLIGLTVALCAVISDWLLF